MHQFKKFVWCYRKRKIYWLRVETNSSQFSPWTNTTDINYTNIEFGWVK